ncbi:ParE family toxin-like protein [Algibacillus agarilyticus]|uniref:ParE family toxin-like protein n=1 Tax=Algibacillus agarilyticus TaxID=2234133 RepID=UPI000DCFAC8E
MMLKSIEKLLISLDAPSDKNGYSACSSKILPNSVLTKSSEVLGQLQSGRHPQSFGAKKIRCLPNLYRMRLSHSYRMLIGVKGECWTALGIYIRQHFTTLLNRRRR